MSVDKERVCTKVVDVAGVQLRTATISDLDAIVGFNHALFQEDAGQRDPWINLDWAREEGSEHFTRHITTDSSLVMVADLDDRIVGYLVGYVAGSGSLRPIRVGTLESMFVSSDVRSRGIGRRLAEAFLEWCRTQRVQRISVTAYASNDGAIRFYRRMGFEPHHLTLEHSV